MLNIEKFKNEIIKVMSISRTDGALKTFMAVKTGRDCKDYRNISYREAIEWLTEEYKEPILDDVERKYLSAVIKPFRKNVNYISKIDVNYPAFNQFISIKVNHTQCVNLPNFSKKSGMYKGMKVGIHYTLQELGL